MKTPKLTILAIITAIAVNVISTLCGILIWQSEDMLLTSKFSFTCIVLLVVGVSIYFFIRFYDAKESEKFLNIIEEKDDYKGNLNTIISEQENRIYELAEEVYQKNEDIKKLQDKCETLENYRSSFPYEVSDGYVIYNIIRLELTATYSKWLIVGIFEEDLWSYPILRPANQKYKEMLKLVSSTKEPEDLKELEQNENLFWE